MRQALLLLALGGCVGDPMPPSRSPRDPASTAGPEVPFEPGPDPLVAPRPSDAGAPPARGHQHPGGDG
jgi:hypothetical protein